VRKSSKLLAVRHGRVLLVRRRKDGRWTLPGGKRKRPAEHPNRCLRRELQEELPALRVKARHLRTVKGRNPNTGRRLHKAVFIARMLEGSLRIGDRRELKRAAWKKPKGKRLAPNSRYICDLLLGPA
jgi:ADP-ribose pyrophosphatase YjhB (NUDIX family)